MFLPQWLNKKKKTKQNKTQKKYLGMKEKKINETKLYIGKKINT